MMPGLFFKLLLFFVFGGVSRHKLIYQLSCFVVCRTVVKTQHQRPYQYSSEHIIRQLHQHRQYDPKYGKARRMTNHHTQSVNKRFCFLHDIFPFRFIDNAILRILFLPCVLSKFRRGNQVSLHLSISSIVTIAVKSPLLFAAFSDKAMLKVVYRFNAGFANSKRPAPIYLPIFSHCY